MLLAAASLLGAEEAAHQARDCVPPLAGAADAAVVDVVVAGAVAVVVSDVDAAPALPPPGPQTSVGIVVVVVQGVPLS